MGSSHKSQTFKWVEQDISDLRRSMLHLHSCLFLTPPHHVMRSTQMIGTRRVQDVKLPADSKRKILSSTFDFPDQTSTFKNPQTILTSKLWCAHPVTVSSTASLLHMKKKLRGKRRAPRNTPSPMSSEAANPPERSPLPAERLKRDCWL